MREPTDVRWEGLTLSMRLSGAIVNSRTWNITATSFHALCGISRVIHYYDRTAANVHELKYLKDVKWE